MSNIGIEYFGLKNTGTHGVFANGEVSVVPDLSVYVSSESDLENLPADLPAGTVAIQYGFAGMWQLNSEGEWVNMLPSAD